MIDELGSKLSGRISSLVSIEPLSCLETVQNYMGLALSAEYIERYFDENKRMEVVEMVNSIKETLIVAIDDESKWMDKVTKIDAKNKVNSMVAYVGYPNELRNKTLMHNLYSELDIDEWKFFDNILAIRRLMTNLEFSRLHKSAYDNKWLTFRIGTQVNSYYYREFNTFNLHSAQLSQDFFNSIWHKAIKYGKLGSLIAHEMSHAFDLNSINYDHRGNRRINLSSQDEQSKGQYRALIECVRNQYEGLQISGGTRVNGSETLNENWADISGYELAYRAYVKVKEQDKMLTSNDIGEQLFWTSAASIWCDNSANTSLEPKSLHSPAKLRVNVAISNLDQFARDFGCPAGSNMNPINKCTIW